MWDPWIDRLWAATTDHERSEIIDELIHSTGRSAAKVYRDLKKAGWESGRRPRTDQGCTNQDPNVMQILASAVGQAIRKNGKAIMPVNVMRSILEANGMEFQVSDARLRHLMRRAKMDIQSQKAAPPAQRMRSLRPNHIHQCDPSLATVYYVPGQGQLILNDNEVYKNKDWPEKTELFKCWRYVLTDHFSSSVCARYYAGKGETALNLWDFLLYAWAPKPQPLYLFHGLPDLLIWDAGSANMSRPITRALTGLRVETKAHMPGKPRGKGQVEGRNNIVETHFESRLRFEPVKTIADLNQAVERWCAAFNADQIKGLDYRLQRGGRLVGSRLSLWQTIQDDQLRELPDPDTCRLLLTHEPVHRKLDGYLSFSYDYPRRGRQTYQMDGREGLEVGQEVMVQPILTEAEPVVLARWKHNGELMAAELKPLAFNEAGFATSAAVFGQEYKRPADTESQKVRKALTVLAHGTQEPAKNAVPFAAFADGQGLKAHSFLNPQTDINPAPKVGKAVDIGPEVIMAYDITISAVEALKRVRARVGELPEGMLDRLRSDFPDGVPVGVVDDLAEEILNPHAGSHLKLLKEA